jgi:hypothetical protein
MRPLFLVGGGGSRKGSRSRSTWCGRGSGSRSRCARRRGSRRSRGQWCSRRTTITVAASAAAPIRAIPGRVAADAPPRAPTTAATTVAASVAVRAPAHMTARRGAVARAPAVRIRPGGRGSQCQHYNSARQKVVPTASIHCVALLPPRETDGVLRMRGKRPGRYRETSGWERFRGSRGRPDWRSLQRLWRHTHRVLEPPPLVR